MTVGGPAPGKQLGNFIVATSGISEREAR